tara:strand:- start:46 stop:741 length:696 start_codon:yes stop_codon:yes gene_type:complete
VRAPPGRNIFGVRMSLVESAQDMIEKARTTMPVARDASDPFHHDCKKTGQDGKLIGGKKQQQVTIRGHPYTIWYPTAPTVDQQARLLKLPAIACSNCSSKEMRRGDCHAVWLVDKLRKKFQWGYGPDLISAAVPPEAIARGRKHQDWKRAKQIHRHAFVACRACHVSLSRGCHGLPSFVDGVKLGGSIFGNPFQELPLKQSRALFERYVDNNFEMLSDAQVKAIANEAETG